jgi:hypothetical protein
MTLPFKAETESFPGREGATALERNVSLKGMHQQEQIVASSEFLFFV